MIDPKTKRFLQSWVINTLAVLVAVKIVPGLRFSDSSILTPFITSLLLGILNAFFRPLLMFFALPLLIFTLGLFTLIINAFLLYLVGLLLGRYFEVDSFWAALLGAIIISIVSVFLNIVTGTGNAKVKIERRRPPSGPSGGRGGGGGGPVIDV